MESQIVNLPDNTFMRNCPTRLLFIYVMYIYVSRSISEFI